MESIFLVFSDALAFNNNIIYSCRKRLQYSYEDEYIGCSVVTTLCFVIQTSKQRTSELASVFRM